jgi:hypothetical protein
MNACASNAVDIGTRACTWSCVNRSAEDRRDASAIRASERRDAASPRSSVSSRRLSGAHNSGIAGGHSHAVGATIAVVAKHSRDSGRDGDSYWAIAAAPSMTLVACNAVARSIVS